MILHIVAVYYSIRNPPNMLSVVMTVVVYAYRALAITSRNDVTFTSVWQKARCKSMLICDRMAQQLQLSSYYYKLDANKSSRQPLVSLTSLVVQLCAQQEFTISIAPAAFENILALLFIPATLAIRKLLRNACDVSCKRSIEYT